MASLAESIYVKTSNGRLDCTIAFACQIYLFLLKDENKDAGVLGQFESLDVRRETSDVRSIIIDHPYHN
jgi:hypothetical protein